MADYLGLIDSKQWIEISEDFEYAQATKDFVALKLFPMFKTDNMKLAVARLAEGGKIPVMALVHALDTEARIGDRPNYEEVNYELFLIKEKLNQGEALRKLMLSTGLSNDQKKIYEIIYDDIANLIMRVLTRVEVMGCQALCNGKIFINENGVSTEVDFGLKADHRFDLEDWSDPTHSILADLVALKKLSKNKIVRALCSDTAMGYILANNEMAHIANTQVPAQFLTEDFAKSYLQNMFGIEFIVVDGTFKTSALSNTEYKFFDEDKVVFLTTQGEVGKTFITTTPIEDYGLADSTNGMVSVMQWKTVDPAGVWTKAEAIAFPCFADIDVLYIGTLVESSDDNG